MFYVIFHAVRTLVDLLLDLCWFMVIASVIASWLVVLGVLNVSNPTVRQALRALDSITEPVYRRIRKILPPMGGLDLSPVIVIIAILVLQVLFYDLFTYLMFL